MSELDRELIIDPLRRLEEDFQRQVEKAGIRAVFTEAPTPETLVGTIFGIAHKSAVGPREPAIRVGFDRGDDQGMVVTEVTIDYDHLQGPVWRYHLKATRKDVMIWKKDAEGNPYRAYIDGVGSSEILFVGKTPFAQGLRELGGVVPSHMEGLPTTLSPEPMVVALGRAKTYRVQVLRGDRESHIAEYKMDDTPIPEGIARALLAIRSKPLIVIQTHGDNDSAFGPGDTPGTWEGAVNLALREQRENDG